MARNKPGTHRTLAQEWFEFSLLAVPANAGPIQRREMKRAWYAGASSVFTIITELDPGDEPTDADMESMTKLNDEIAQFTLDVISGKE